ncbi:MAG TPA: hypothetical protein VGB37_16525 [Candidatus Lokiarchaeia archaeon]
MKRMYSDSTGNISNPSLDTSLGLIFRLNSLWQKTDPAALSGNFDRWNFLLDRIFCNLLFKNELEVEKEENKILKVKLCKDDEDIYDYLNQKVFEAQTKLIKTKEISDIRKAKLELYRALMLKDVGLRKFMHIRLKLYLKEVETNPARAMWGY